MTIKNLTRFLMAATLMSTAVLAQAEPVSAPEQKPTAEAFAHIETPVESLRRIRGTNLRDEPVRILSGNHLSEADIAQYHEAMGDNFALSGRLQGENVCMLFIEDRSDEGFILPQYTQDSLFAFIQRDTYMYHLVAHELSHCLQYGNETPLQAAQAQIKDLSVANAEVSLSALDASAREVHADLTAVLLGASKTGDWSVMTEAVLPLRASYYSPTHTTLNALSNLLDGVDPAILKKASFDEVVQLSNALFKRRFISEGGQLDLQSPGVKDILREWAVTGLEARAYLEQVNAQENSQGQAFLRGIRDHESFAKAIVGDTLWKDAAHISAWRAVNLIEQNQVASRAKPSNDVSRFVSSNQIKLESFPVIVRLAERQGKVEGSYTDQVEQIARWKNQFNTYDNSATLKSGLPTLLNEAFARPDDPSYARKVNQAREKVTALLRDTLTATRLPGNHRINTLTGLLDNPNTPSLKARKNGALSKLAALELP